MYLYCKDFEGSTPDNWPNEYEEVPEIHIYNIYGIKVCVAPFGYDLKHQISSRRICRNSDGRVIVSDYRNCTVFFFEATLSFSENYELNYPTNICPIGKYVYATQDDGVNCLTLIDFKNLCKDVVLKKKDTQLPTCIAFSRNRKMWIDCLER